MRDQSVDQSINQSNPQSIESNQQSIIQQSYWIESFDYSTVYQSIKCQLLDQSISQTASDNQSISQIDRLINQSINQSEIGDLFYSGVHWNFDGSKFITSIKNDYHSSIHQFNQSIIQSADQSSNQSNTSLINWSTSPSLSIKLGARCYDYMYLNPAINQSISQSNNQLNNQPSGQLIASVCKDHPIRLIDSLTGTVVRSYTADRATDQSINQSVNHSKSMPSSDHFLSAYSIGQSVNQSISESNLVAGYVSEICLFDIETGQAYLINQSNNQSKRIIAALDCSIDHCLIAAGSLSNQSNNHPNNRSNLTLYDIRSGDLMCSINQSNNQSINQVKFSNDSRFLFSANRSTNQIDCFDLRVLDQSIYSLNQSVSRVGYFDRTINQSKDQTIDQSNNQSNNRSSNQTINQPINFAIDPSQGRWLASGCLINPINHSINRSHKQSINQTIDETIEQSVDQSINPSIKQPSLIIFDLLTAPDDTGGIKESFRIQIPECNQSINQSTNRTINQSHDQSTNQSLVNCVAFHPYFSKYAPYLLVSTGTRSFARSIKRSNNQSNNQSNKQSSSDSDTDEDELIEPPDSGIHTVWTG